MKNLKKVLTVMSTTLAISLTSSALMAAYPEKPINVIVPWGAGGDSDLTTRIWAKAIEKDLGVPVVVINKSGGGGIIGTSFVARSRKDGYTLINAGLSNMLVTPNFSKAPYSFDSFSPILKMTSVPLGIIVAEDSPYKTFPEFVNGAKVKTITQGSWGASSSGTILAEIISKEAGYKPRYINAKSSAESMVSLVGGHIDSAIAFPPSFGPHVKAGRARILVMNKKMAEYPNTPTFADYGIKGSFEGWSGIFAPKGVPQEVIDRLVAATVKAMKDPDVIAQYKNIGATMDFRYGPEWIADMKENYGMMKTAAADAKK
ncbi:tripartite tricarboxylate transporter substrate binding protein [Marinomonas arenicola]|uniref:Tripartite tricarboxylate transporter substrate binding protein n=1 Tax=Marinomonas arenicola TaxID=569601 RepID=A0ABU9GAW9_9GAMM